MLCRGHTATDAKCDTNDGVAPDSVMNVRRRGEVIEEARRSTMIEACLAR